MATITQKVSTEEMRRIAVGRQPFVVVDEHAVTEGDLLAFEDPEGRSLVRRVETTIDLIEDIIEDSIVRVTVAGLSAGTKGPLDAAFGGGGILIGFAIEKRQGQVEIAQAPQYLPALVCIPIDLDQALEQLQVPRWPDGVFSILLSAQLISSVGRLTSEVREFQIFTLTRHDNLDVFCELDHRLLLEGKLQDVYGKTLEPYFGQPEVDDAAGQDIGSSLTSLLDDLQEGDDTGDLA
jgi:hypothetical protein